MVDVEKIHVWKCKDLIHSEEDRVALQESFYRVGMVSTNATDHSATYSCIYLHAKATKFSECQANRLQWLNELQETMGNGADALQWRYYKYGRKKEKKPEQNGRAKIEKGGIQWVRIDANNYFHKQEVTKAQFADEAVRRKANLNAVNYENSLVQQKGGDLRWKLTNDRYMWVLLVAEWIAFTTPGRAMACILAGNLKPRRKNGEALTNLKVYCPGKLLGDSLASVFSYFQNRKNEPGAKDSLPTLRKRTREAQSPLITEVESADEYLCSESNSYVPGVGLDTEAIRELYREGKRPDAELRALQCSNDLRENVEGIIEDCDYHIRDMENLISIHKVELEIQMLNMRRLEENMEWEKQRCERMRKNLEYTEKRLKFERELKEMYQRNFFKQPRTSSPSPDDSV